MLATVRRAAGNWALAFCFVGLLFAERSHAAEMLEAGVGRVVITPAEPVWLCGYSSRTAPATDKVHDLWGKALAIRGADGTLLVLLTLDLGSVSEEITAAVAQRCGLPRGSLITNVSHTHCAPEVAAERRVFHALSDAEEAKLAAYIEWLKGALAECVQSAVADLAPAQLLLSHGQAGFGYNRRLPSNGTFINSQNVDGPRDTDVPVLQVRSPEGELRAILFGYACHNTVCNFQQFCGDYAGFAQYKIEERHPGAVALFCMGCGGDQNPYPRHGERQLEYAAQHGTELADGVEQALASEQREVHGPLRTAFEVVDLELEPLPERAALEQQAANDAAALAQRKARYLLDRLDHEGTIELVQTCPLHAARLGEELLFVAVSGETTLDYQLRSKQQFAGPDVWVAGYCDDVFAYLPSRRVLLEGGYEGRDGIIHQLTPTPFEQSVEERVFAGLDRLVEQVSR